MQVTQQDRFITLKFAQFDYYVYALAERTRCDNCTENSRISLLQLTHWLYRSVDNEQVVIVSLVYQNTAGNISV